MANKIKHTGDFPKGHIPWNNGLVGKGICKANDGSIKKGERRGIKTEFTEGHMPTNGFKKGQPADNKGKHIQTNTGRTHFKKGQVSPNKGKKRPNISGENSPHWQGGITPENVKIRNSLEIKLFKKACLERDNFTCQKTKQRGGELVVHHINNFAYFPELRTSISNGITLSAESHREFHKKYGLKNNTREQLLEFIKR